MKPAAKAGDTIVADDTHVIMSPAGVACAVPLLAPSESRIIERQPR